MSYLLESKKAALKDINAANGTSYTTADVTFGVPSPSQGSWQGGVTDRNTVVRLTAVEGGLYEGTAQVAYDRLSLNDLPKVKGWKAIQTNPTTIHNLLPYLKYFTGVDLTPADVEDGGFTSNGDNTYAGTLTAKAGSIGWIGSTPVTVYPGGVRLDDVIEEDNLPGLNYPTALDTDIYGQFYLYSYDFTPNYNTFVDLEEDAELAGAELTAVVAAIKAVDIGSGKDLWTADAGTAQWSLGGATVVRNGLNGSDLPTNPSYKYVLVIRPRSGMNTPAGDLYLHYNDPLI